MLIAQVYILLRRARRLTWLPHSWRSSSWACFGHVPMVQARGLGGKAESSFRGTSPLALLRSDGRTYTPCTSSCLEVLSAKLGYFEVFLQLSVFAFGKVIAPHS